MNSDDNRYYGHEILQECIAGILRLEHRTPPTPVALLPQGCQEPREEIYSNLPRVQAESICNTTLTTLTPVKEAPSLTSHKQHQAPPGLLKGAWKYCLMPLRSGSGSLGHYLDSDCPGQCLGQIELAN